MLGFANERPVHVVCAPNDDYLAIPLAWKAFTQLNARYFFINGAGREVMWADSGVYTNSLAISDPSRFPGHPLHLTYMKSCEEILSNVNFPCRLILTIQTCISVTQIVRFLQEMDRIVPICRSEIYL